MLSILALFDLGSDACVLSKPPIGNNMAFRKELFAQYGAFRTDLGPAPGVSFAVKIQSLAQES